MDAHTHAYTLPLARLHARTRKHALTHSCACACARVCIRACVHVCVCVRVGARVRVCPCMHMHMCTYTGTRMNCLAHTHAHRKVWQPSLPKSSHVCHQGGGSCPFAHLEGLSSTRRTPWQASLALLAFHYHRGDSRGGPLLD